MYYERTYIHHIFTRLCDSASIGCIPLSGERVWNKCTICMRKGNTFCQCYHDLCPVKGSPLDAFCVHIIWDCTCNLLLLSTAASSGMHGSVTLWFQTTSNFCCSLVVSSVSAQSICHSSIVLSSEPESNSW